MKLRFLLPLLLAASPALAQPTTTKPPSNMVLSPCLSNVPLVGGGASVQIGCWATGALGAAAALTVPITVANGGTGLATLTANAVMLGNATGTVAFATIGTGGRMLLDQGAAANPAFTAMSGDGALTSGGVFALSNIPSGTTMAGSILSTNIVAPGTPASGKTSLYVDSTQKVLSSKNDAGTVSITVVPNAGSSNNFVTALSAAGVLSTARPTCANLSDSTASCATDATNASNISSGTLPNGRLTGIYSGITGTGTLTSGASGAGFTLGLSLSTITGTLTVPNGGTGAATFTANLPLIGNGASAVAQGTRSGTTTQFVTTTGTLTASDCVQIDANGNFIAAGGPCTTGGGGGTVTSGTAGQLTYYATTSTTVAGNPNATISSGALTLGIPTSILGQLILSGNTSGAITITPQAAAGTYEFDLPTTAGSADQILTSQGGAGTAMTWQNIASRLTAGTNITITGTTNATIGLTNNATTVAGQNCVLGSSCSLAVGDITGAAPLASPTFTGSATFPNSSGIKILDTNASNTLGIIVGSDLTSDRTFTLTTGDASRVFTMTGDLAMSGAFALTLTTTNTTNVTLPTTGTLATLAGTETLSGKTLTTPKIASGGYLADANGNELIIFTTTASAVNEITYANAATGNSPTLTASGGDTDVGITITGKGAKGVTAGNAFTETRFALTDGATPALDASLGNIFTLITTTNPTIAVPTNPVIGQKIVIRVNASGGARTVALNTGTNGFRFGSDITGLTATSSGKTDYIGAIWNSTDSKWDVVAYVKGF